MTVGDQVQGVHGQTMTLTDKGREKKVTIVPDKPAVMIYGAT